MQLSQNIASPKYLGTERYVIFENSTHFAYIDLLIENRIYKAFTQTGVKHRSLLSGSPEIGTEKEVLKRSMDSLKNYWQCFDSEIIKNFSYPMPLKELQLELF